MEFNLISCCWCSPSVEDYISFYVFLVLILSPFVLLHLRADYSGLHLTRIPFETIPAVYFASVVATQFDLATRSAGVPGKCSFCKEAFEEAIPDLCTSCGTAYHSECFMLNQKCPVYGCRGKELVVMPEPALHYAAMNLIRSAIMEVPAILDQCRHRLPAKHWNPRNFVRRIHRIWRCGC